MTAPAGRRFAPNHGSSRHDRAFTGAGAVTHGPACEDRRPGDAGNRRSVSRSSVRPLTPLQGRVSFGQQAEAGATCSCGAHRPPTLVGQPPCEQGGSFSAVRPPPLIRAIFGRFFSIFPWPLPVAVVAKRSSEVEDAAPSRRVPGKMDGFIHTVSPGYCDAEGFGHRPAWVDRACCHRR